MLSCASSEKQLKVKTAPVEIKRVIHDRPLPLIEPKIRFQVLTEEQVEKLEDREFVFFGLDEKNYLTFSKWLRDVLRYIEESGAVFEAYEREVNRGDENNSSTSENK